ncbi:hypothetical protein CHARACLAT_021328 [Characodon lateralis]|uniref:Uncharacterized protein n=1 Tax=Characodon lateralis TaxID=208331 RepID=A0ABU7E299_9TELE|nr:hypothetical protein [Characodon lateralis]
MNPEIWAYSTVSPGSVQYLLLVPGLGSFGIITASMRCGTEEISLWFCQGSAVQEVQVALRCRTSTPRHCWFWCVIVLLTTAHRFSIEFGSDQFGGVTMVINAWIGTLGSVGWYQVLLDLHKACQQKRSMKFW